MSETTLKFDNIRINKKIHKSKQPIDLMPVNLDQIVLSDKFKHSDECYKYFIGYQGDKINHYVLFYLKWVDPLNIFKKVLKTCLFLLEMIMSWINTMKFEMWLKKSWKLNFIACLFMMKNT